MVKSMLIIMATYILTNNYVLSQILGICPFLGVSKKLDNAIGMSLAVTFVLVMASATTYPVYMYFLLPNGLEYLSTIVFILLIAFLVQLVETILKKYIPALYRALGVYLPLITTNCIVLGVTLLNIKENFSFMESIAHAVGAGAGFFLAMVLFSGVRQRLENIDMPKSFEGVPITLAAASILSLSFMGFSGVVENLFG